MVDRLIAELYELDVEELEPVLAEFDAAGKSRNPVSSRAPTASAQGRPPCH
jgi:hypothetical protein